ncbi:MAG TPA: Uma2 family endonuclease [Isosphaeraceae bacterium]|nr:Uma2 family endonuclease [Isosphaeraceae bacterium]
MATDTKRRESDRSSEGCDRIPALRNGDHLSADEFMRRYQAMPHLKKAELIEGRVYVPSPDSDLAEWKQASMSSPVSYEGHCSPHFYLAGWFFLFAAATPGVRGGVDGTVLLDLKNRPQPDGFLFIEPRAGGQVRYSPDDYIDGAPDLVAEVAYSTASVDMHEKLQAYERNAAREYLVWRVEDRSIDWFVLRENRYQPLEKATDGIFRSEVLPGLWLDPEALLDGSLTRFNAVAQQGLASPEHAAFVEKLRQNAAEIAGAKS